MPKKSRFQNMENKIEEVTNKANLHESKPKSKTKNMVVYNISEEITEKIKESNISFSSFAKMAILEKLNRAKQ